jgi:hypothetical protein
MPPGSPMFQHRIEDGEQLVHAGRQRHLFLSALRSALSEAECLTPVDTGGFDIVKLNKTFRWVGIPCSWDCFRCWPRCWRSKVKTAAKGQQELLESTIDPPVIRSYFIGPYL